MPEQDFNLASAVRGMASHTFQEIRSNERAIAERLACKGTDREFAGDPNYSCRIPASALRDLTAGSTTGGGYLVDTKNLGYAPVLRPKSVVLRAGATVAHVTGSNVLVPQGLSGITVNWQSNEASTITESQLVFGQVSTNPKHLTAFCEISRQLLLQSNADAILRQELTAAAAAALDAAVLAGSGGSGQPQGIIGTSGVGSVAGTTLAFAGILEFQQDVAAANAGHDPATCAFITTPTVAGLMKSRQRFSGTDSPIWVGPLTAGRIDEMAAYATLNCPTGDMLYGDFSQVTIVTWDDLRIEVDPFTKDKQLLVGVRLWLPLDVVVRHPAAFSLATGVT